MTVMGLQVTPTCPVREPTTTPKRPRRVAMDGELAAWTLLQHWSDPVLHWLLGPDPVPVGVAAARVATARVERTASLNCMITEVVGRVGMFML
jgi:hypothetical protein